MESIPECLTDEEALDYEDIETSVSHKRNRNIYKKRNKNGISTKPNIHVPTHNEIMLLEDSRNIYPPKTVVHENNSKFEHDFLSKCTERKGNERLSVSLIDLTKCNRDNDNGRLRTLDKELPFSNITLSDTNVERLTSDKNTEDYISNTNNSNPYQKHLLQPSLITTLDFQTHKSDTYLNSDIQKKIAEESDHSNKDKVNSGILNTPILKNKWGSELNVPSSFPAHSRQRSGSVQWIHNAFHNVEQKCRDLLDIRRPSDIAEQQMRKSNEELEMEISEDESSKFGPSSSTSGRRFSENILGKRLFPFSTGIVHLRDLWKDRNVNKRNETKDIDQIRPDVCPLFTFPKNVDEDEMILDSLRQAMRKCTAVDPTVRPPSASVLEQLSSLLK